MTLFSKINIMSSSRVLGTTPLWHPHRSLTPKFSRRQSSRIVFKIMKKLWPDLNRFKRQVNNNVHHKMHMMILLSAIRAVMQPVVLDKLKWTCIRFKIVKYSKNRVPLKLKNSKMYLEKLHYWIVLKKIR